MCGNKCGELMYIHMYMILEEYNMYHMYLDFHS